MTIYQGFASVYGDAARGAGQPLSTVGGVGFTSRMTMTDARTSATGTSLRTCGKRLTGKPGKTTA